MKNIKSMLSDALLCFVSMYGSAWIAFLIGMIALYIFRGVYHNSATREMYENLLGMSIGLLISFALLVLRYRSQDGIGKKTAKEMTISALIGGGIYWLLWVISGGIYAVAVNGYYLCVLIGRQKNGNPTAPGALVGATVFCAVYIAAVILGSFLARRKRNPRN